MFGSGKIYIERKYYLLIFGGIIMSNRRELTENETTNVAGGAISFKGGDSGVAYEIDTSTYQKKAGALTFSYENKELCKQWLENNWTGAITQDALIAMSNLNPPLVRLVNE